jgi:hypothetical protein
VSEPASFAKQPTTAVIEVRLSPWRPRRRRFKADRFGEDAGELLIDVGSGFDDLGAFAIALLVLGLIFVAAPVLVLLLVTLLLPLEVLLAVILGALLLLIRFAGIVPWSVVLTERDDTSTTEHYRNLINAINRVWTVNGNRRIPLRFSLT